jgi:hypothetical protein
MDAPGRVGEWGDAGTNYRTEVTYEEWAPCEDDGTGNTDPCECLKHEIFNYPHGTSRSPYHPTPRFANWSDIDAYDKHILSDRASTFSNSNTFAYWHWCRCVNRLNSAPMTDRLRALAPSEDMVRRPCGKVFPGAAVGTGLIGRACDGVGWRRHRHPSGVRTPYESVLEDMMNTYPIGSW